MEKNLTSIAKILLEGNEHKERRKETMTQTKNNTNKQLEKIVQHSEDAYASLISKGYSKEDAEKEIAALYPELHEGKKTAIDYNKIDLTQFSEEEKLLHLSKMTPEQVSSALVRAVEAMSQKPEVKVEQVTPFALLTTPKGMKVPLSELIHLEDTPIKDAIQGVRPINRENVESLKAAYASGDSARIAEIPAMKLQRSTEGFIIVAGRHREIALLEVIMDKYLANPLMVDSNGELTKSALGIYKNELETFYVKYEATDLTEYELPEYAALDNIKNGKSLDTNARSAIVWFIFNRQLEEYKKGLRKEKPSVEGLALRVGITRGAPYMYRKRLLEKTKPSKKDVLVSDKDLSVNEKAESDTVYNAQDNKRQPDILDRTTRDIINASLRISQEQITFEDLVGHVQKFVDTSAKYDALQLLSEILVSLSNPETKQVTPPTTA